MIYSNYDKLLSSNLGDSMVPGYGFATYILIKDHKIVNTLASNDLKKTKALI
jgi:hypothetical protein